jgi:hypothetical protein
LLDGVAGILFLAKGQVASCFAVVRAHFSFYGNILYWFKKRRQNRRAYKMPVPQNLVYSQSIVFAFFARGKKKFSDLKF